MWGDVAFYLGLFALALLVSSHSRVWLVGVALGSTAFPLWILARVQLGSALTIKPEARHLVTSGLYSRIRHPVYLFGTLASLSALLALQIWPLLAMGVAFVPITLYRVWREESVLRAAFGPEYERYRKRTWF